MSELVKLLRAHYLMRDRDGLCIAVRPETAKEAADRIEALEDMLRKIVVFNDSCGLEDDIGFNPQGSMMRNARALLEDK